MSKISNTIKQKISENTFEEIQVSYIGPNYTWAEGKDTTAVKTGAHAEGIQSQAIGAGSHAEGYFTTAQNNYQHVQGILNENDVDNVYAHIVGGGDIETQTPKNIHTLDWDGNSWCAGDVSLGSTCSLQETEDALVIAYHQNALQLKDDALEIQLKDANEPIKVLTQNQRQSLVETVIFTDQNITSVEGDNQMCLYTLVPAVESNQYTSIDIIGNTLDLASLVAHNNIIQIWQSMDDGERRHHVNYGVLEDGVSARLRIYPPDGQEYFQLTDGSLKYSIYLNALTL